MIEKLFKYRAVIDRYKGAPFLEERERFLTYKEEQGCSQETLTSLARELFWMVSEFGFDGRNLRKVTLYEIQRAASKWAQKKYRSGQAESVKWPSRFFIQVATDWFRFLDLLYEPVPQSAWYVSFIEDFAAFMEHERGLSPKTIKSECWQVEQFLRWSQPKLRKISSIRVTDVDNFLTTYGSENWSRVSIASNVKALRAFFRYATKRGWCGSEIAESIQGPRLFSNESIPAGPTWEEVKRLLGSMDTKQPLEIRDRAIVLLFALYGIRSSEVANLRLEQINWCQSQITIIRKKQRRSDIYPLIPIVGNAIIDYLQAVRPCCALREVFLTIKAPIKPLSIGALYHAVSKRMVKLGISTVGRGPHALRHACATHLVAAGLSLKEIGDHLGHRSTSATRIYAKIDMPHLREVATFNFGGAL